MLHAPIQPYFHCCLLQCIRSPQFRSVSTSTQTLHASCCSMQPCTCLLMQACCTFLGKYWMRACGGRTMDSRICVWAPALARLLAERALQVGASVFGCCATFAAFVVTVCGCCNSLWLLRGTGVLQGLGMRTWWTHSRICVWAPALARLLAERALQVGVHDNIS